jgi:hypothetical protein
MKAARVRGRRTGPDGRRLVNVICPKCNHCHWFPEGEPGWCAIRNTAFTIAERNPR